jgi:hypothetical protein
LVPYRAAIDVPLEVVEHVPWLIYARRRELYSPWRRLSCFRQALLVVAHLRSNATLAELGAGFSACEFSSVPSPLPAPSKTPVGETTPSETTSPSATENQKTTALPSAPAGLVIRVLGPVDVAGAQHTTERRYLRTLTEIAARIALHPGLHHRALDEAIWPGREVSRQTRNPWISRLRSWLGADGRNQHFPPIATTTDARHRFADTVTTDWAQFQNLVHSGLNTADSSGAQCLRQPLNVSAADPSQPPSRAATSGPNPWYKT